MSTSSQYELQKLLYETLKADADVMALADDVYDAVPPDPFNEKSKNGYISFGAVDVVDDDATCITAGVHTIQLDCWSRRVGSVHCKRMVDAVRKALHEKPLQLTDNALAEIRVLMTMTMRDPDGLTTHGVLQVEAQIEELA